MKCFLSPVGSRRHTRAKRCQSVLKHALSIEWNYTSVVMLRCRTINLRCVPEAFNPQVPSLTFSTDFAPKVKALQLLLILERVEREKGITPD